MKDLSQKGKIVMYMVSNQDTMWFYPYDFMKKALGNLFVGYEASARLSELRSEYPLIFKGQKDGKYMMTRIDYEMLEKHQSKLPTELRLIFEEAEIINPEVDKY